MESHFLTGRVQYIGSLSHFRSTNSPLHFLQTKSLSICSINDYTSPNRIISSISIIQI